MYKINQTVYAIRKNLGPHNIYYNFKTKSFSGGLTSGCTVQKLSKAQETLITIKESHSTPKKIEIVTVKLEVKPIPIKE